MVPLDDSLVLIEGHHVIAWTGAAYSCIIGVIFLFGISSHLPALG